MEQKCKEAFLAFASGELGMNMISEFVQILRQGYAVSLSHGLGPRQARAKTLFEAVLCGMGDIWKRLVQETRVFPFKMFQLCDLPPDKFRPVVEVQAGAGKLSKMRGQRIFQWPSRHQYGALHT